MIKIKPFGASNNIGRSCFMLYDDQTHILLDAGIQLYPRRTGKFSDGPSGVEDYVEDLDAVLLTHAHIDHSGYIPALYRAGFRGKVYMTSPTKPITEILWKDHLKIEGPHHYGIPHLQQAIRNTKTVKYNRKVKIGQVTAEFTNAGHVLGSAGIILDWNGESRVFYTGDFNDAKTPFHDPVEYPDPDQPIDYLIMESTNARRPLPTRKEVTSMMTKSLLKCYKNKGKAIIPSFALGRSQEIQLYLAQIFDSFLEKFPVYLDGMIITMNKIYEHFLDEKWVSPRLLIWMEENGLRSPFDHPGLNELNGNRRGNKDNIRRELAKRDQSLIIITTSGMMEGGPIHDYLRYAGAETNNKLMISGYQVKGTIGSDIASGKRHVSLTDNYGNTFEINLGLAIERYSFSGHVSLNGLIDMAKFSSPKEIILVHGEEDSQTYLKSKLLSEGYKTTILTEQEPYSLVN